MIVEIYLDISFYFYTSRNMKTFTPAPLDTVTAASAFAALGSEQRLLILKTLVRAGSEGCSMGELAKRTEVTGSTLTHHLKILAAADLVSQSKSGRSIICAAVAYDHVETLSKYLLENCCADSDCDDADESASNV